MRDEEMLAIKRSVQTDLLRLPGVHAVGLGLKFVNGRPTDEIAIQVFVRRKRPAIELAPGEMIPPVIRGIPTDVRESRPVVPLSGAGEPQCPAPDRCTHRPLVGGVSVEAVGAFPGQIGKFGTLGCLAWTRETPARAVALSNHHVLMGVAGSRGSKVGQPNTIDCGECCSNIIGTIHDAKLTLLVDGATALLEARTQDLQWRPWIEEIGVVAGKLPSPLVQAQLPYFVQKRGAQTGKTEGFIAGLDRDGKAFDNDGNFVRDYAHQIEIVVQQGSPLFSDFGDSGSAVLDEENRVVGLLWGGTGAGDDPATACHIDDVENELEVDIAIGTSPGDVHTVPAQPGTASTRHAHATTTSQSSARPLLGSLSPTNDRRLLATGGDEVARWLRSVDEASDLITNNTRVAAIWQRNNGPEVARRVLGGQQLPASSGTRSLADRADRILHVLARYGSAALRADIANLRRILALPG